jgi:hypothetical protein
MPGHQWLKTVAFAFHINYIKLLSFLVTNVSHLSEESSFDHNEDAYIHSTIDGDTCHSGRAARPGRWQYVNKRP